MNNQQNTASVSAVPFNPQTQSFTPTPAQPAVSSTAPKTDIKAFNQSMVNAVPPNLQTPSPTITADSLNTPKTVILTGIPTTPATPVNQAEQLLAQTAVADTEAQKASQSLSKGILELIPQLQGQTQSLREAERTQGLPAMRQNLQNINNQILQKQAELQQDDIKLVQAVQNIEDKPIAMEFITGQQQSVQRNAQIARALKASEIGVLNATALGMQGNIALAQETAKQAVETKYAPYKEALETYRLQLEALTPLLNADEKKQAREQELKTKLAFNDIERKQKNEEDLNKMIINASAQNAPQSLLAKAKLEKDPVKAAMVLGQYAGDYYKTQLLKAEIAKTYAQTRALTQPVSSTGKIETLPKAQQERYYKLQGDFDKATEKYRGAIDAAKNLNALSQNSTAQDQTAIIFSYMKTLDPTSTVREGEFALVGNTAGLSDRAINALEQLDSGKRLNQQQITDIVGAASKLANVAKQNLDGTSAEYDRRATKFGLPTGLFYEPQGQVTTDVKSYVDVVDRGLSGQSQSTPSGYLESLGLKKMTQ